MNAHPTHAPVDHLLHLADNALVLGQRNAEWCGHGPVLEEDLALANHALDHLGQARLLYQHAAELINADPTLAERFAHLQGARANGANGADGAITEDTLAYFRSSREFLNFTLLELHRLEACGSDHFPVLIDLALEDPKAEAQRDEGLDAEAEDVEEAEEKTRAEGVSPSAVHQPGESRRA